MVTVRHVPEDRSREIAVEAVRRARAPRSGPDPPPDRRCALRRAGLGEPTVPHERAGIGAGRRRSSGWDRWAAASGVGQSEIRPADRRVPDALAVQRFWRARPALGG